MRLGKTVISVSAAAIALASCGSDGGGMLAAGGSSKWTKDDACKTLPKEAVAAASGKPVVSAENSTNGAGDTVAATCTYTLSAGTVTLLTRSSDTDLSDAEIAQFKDAGGLMPGGEEVAGIGMKAYWNDKVHQLQVVSDRKHYFNITYGPPFTMPGTPAPAGPDPKAMAISLSKSLL